MQGNSSKLGPPGGFSAEIPKPFRSRSYRFPVIRNREFVSTSREILEGDTGLQAAAVSNLPICLFSVLFCSVALAQGQSSNLERLDSDELTAKLGQAESHSQRLRARGALIARGKRAGCRKIDHSPHRGEILRDLAARTQTDSVPDSSVA